jgi:DNA-binding MarR family transcriptional regulator
MLSRTKSKPVTRFAAKSQKYVLDDQVGFLLRVAMQRHTSIFMSQMTSKLTQTQFAALAKLLEVGACSQNQLGRLIYLDAATIKGVVDRLKLRKLITTQADPGDRRRRAITLTEQGARRRNRPPRSRPASPAILSCRSPPRNSAISCGS